MTREISDAGIALIKAEEGLELNAYRDGGGVLTIGYGHTSGVQDGAQITEHQADVMLRSDLADAELCVNQNAPNVNQNQFDALVSFVFNCGCGALAKSTLGRLVRAGDYNAAADQFLRWNHDNGKVVSGLTKRRAAERELFLIPEVPA